MKRIMGIIMLLCCLCSTVFAEGWTYVGRFCLRADMHHVTDVFLVNHLTTIYNQPIGIGHDKYLPYDVYYMHNHTTDVIDRSGEAYIYKVMYKAKIIPLNIYGKPMNFSGAEDGIIISEYYIKAAGAYGIRPMRQTVFDIVKGTQLFEASGDMGTEQLYEESAAVAISRDAGHNINGHGYYTYR